MSEKMVSVRKLHQHYKDRFSRNYIKRLIYKLFLEGKIDWNSYKPISQEDAKVIIKELESIGSATLNGDKTGCKIWNGLKYIKKPEDSFSDSKNGWILEHRYVMEQHLGRKLERNEYIYHINGDKLDNRLENLEVCRGGRGINKARNSIFELIPVLWENAVLGWDSDAKKYIIRPS